jgi:glycosyltransferase involved in cell wall biosynthesis
MTDESKEVRKVLFIGENSVSDAIRCKLPAVELSKMQYADVSYNVLPWHEDPPPPIAGLDAVVFSRPHHDTLLMAYKRMGVPTIVDMDDDFRAIPESHPGYKWVGMGNTHYMTKLENCISLGDRLVVTTDELKERLVNYRMGDYNSIHVIPNGWSSRDPHWLDKRSIYKDRIILGWGGTITHREDFQMIVGPVKQILREYPETMICIAGDTEIYQMFATVKEKQKLFVPMVPYEMYPITLSLWDIMLVPLLNNHFNCAKSDIKLVDAGAMGIPYIASNMPVYWDWPGPDLDSPGLIVDDDAWYAAIKSLVIDEDKRKKMGKAGKKASRTREMMELGLLWRDVIEETIQDLDEGLY